MSLRILLSFVFLLLAGCGSWIGEDEEIADPPAELVDFEPSLQIDELWDRGTGSGTDEQYLLLTPVVADQKIYVADTRLKLLAIDAGNGRNLWTYQLELDNGGFGFWSDKDEVYITGGPGFGENMVLAGTNKGDVIAVNAETGEELWTTKVSSEILSAPQVSSGIVVVRTQDGKIFGISADGGRRLWTYDQTTPALTLRGTGIPAIAGETVLCGFDGGRLSALDLHSGRLIWETSIATPSGRDDLARMVDIDATPVIVENIVYAVSLQGEMTAMTLNTGRVLWNRELSSHAGFSVDANNIYITDDKSVIWAIDRLNGSAVWQQNGLLNRQVTAPASIGNYLAAGDFEGYLHWMDKTTGAFVARQKISGDRIITPPVPDGNVLYVYASDGGLTALNYQ